jgi:hypothetical protein
MTLCDRFLLENILPNQKLVINPSSTGLTQLNKSRPLAPNFGGTGVQNP